VAAHRRRHLKEVSEDYYEYTGRRNFRMRAGATLKNAIPYGDTGFTIAFLTTESEDA
jgi:hypothetical protein